MSRPLRIALLASARHPIAEPFAGGLEAHTWTLARALRGRGHEVTLFAGPGSDPRLDVSVLDVDPFLASPAAQADSSMPAREFLAEHHAYLQVMLALASGAGTRYDIVHNNSLHYLPVAMAAASRAPVVTTLHTPPTPWLESAIRLNGNATFVAVSEGTARAWRPATRNVRVIGNGIDLDRWRPGPGGGPLVWTGRLVPEKGAHLALRAAHLSRRALDVAGPIGDPAYFRDSVQPLLDGTRRYVGHLGGDDLVNLVGRASGAFVTPRWDEPYGLVVAEALACGTPVLAFDRGALGEIVDDSCAVLVPPDDVCALAASVDRLTELSRAAARLRAETACSHVAMVDGYCRVYTELAAAGTRAA